jgi:hypothetical protein
VLTVAKVSLIDVRRDLQNPRTHAYHKLHVVWGRKPEAAAAHSTPSNSQLQPDPGNFYDHDMAGYGVM